MHFPTRKTASVTVGLSLVFAVVAGSLAGARRSLCPCRCSHPGFTRKLDRDEDGVACE